MSFTLRRSLALVLVLSLVLAACSPAATPSPTARPTTVPATDVPAVTESATEEATVEMMMETPTEEATVEMMMETPTEEATVEMMMETPTEEATVEMMMETPTEEATVEMMMEATAEMTEEPLGNIAEIATEAGNFTVLLAAVDAAGLAVALTGDGPLTVFAPTDDAFARLLDTRNLTAEELLANSNLSSILLNHVVAGAVSAEDLLALLAAETDGVLEVPTLLDGASLTFSFDVDGNLVINETVKVTVTDIRASNGIIHVIERVLIPVIR